nr:hypothetical protein GCM10020092_095230 [Actinoplanes digitatis]
MAVGRDHPVADQIGAAAAAGAQRNDDRAAGRLRLALVRAAAVRREHLDLAGDQLHRLAEGQGDLVGGVRDDRVARRVAGDQRGVRGGRRRGTEQDAEEAGQQPEDGGREPPGTRPESVAGPGQINVHACNAPRWLAGPRSAVAREAESEDWRVVVGMVTIVPRTADNSGRAYHLRL